MLRKLHKFLEDILEHAQIIEQFLDGMDKATFEQNTMRRQSVYWSLFCIAEAVSEVLRQDPSLDLEITDDRKIKSFRNVLAHAYFGIDPETVWAMCHKSLPILKAEVEAILGHL